MKLLARHTFLFTKSPCYKLMIYMSEYACVYAQESPKDKIKIRKADINNNINT